MRTHPMQNATAAMVRRLPPLRPIAGTWLVVPVALLMGCSPQPTAVESTVAAPEVPTRAERSSTSEGWEEVRTGPAHAGPDGRVVREWLHEVRRVTRHFHRIDRAVEAGYDVPLTGCMESPDGGMGFHYGNGALIDGVAEASQPEVLLYEPLPNGRLRLVAVEYIVPFAAWAGTEPPEINGVPFHANDAFGVWALHLWAWKANPSGVLEDWNPRVSCRFAS